MTSGHVAGLVRSHIGRLIPFERTINKQIEFQAYWELDVSKPIALPNHSKAKFRRRTSHDPNRMLMRKNKGFFSFAFDSANVKYGV